MATYTRTLYLLDRALHAQRYRRVDLRYIDQNGGIRFPTSASASLDAALREVSATPNWVEVGRQLAQLKLSGFAYLYVRRDKYDLEVIPVYGFKNALTLEKVRGYFDFVWTVTSHLTPALGSFTLSETNWAKLAMAAAEYDGTPAPTKDTSPAGSDGLLPSGEDDGPLGVQTASPSQQKAVSASILRSVVDMHWARVPTTALAVVAVSGPTAELEAMASKRNGSNLFKQAQVSLSSLATPSQSTLVLDCRDLSVHGNPIAYSVNLEQLRQAIPFLNSQA